MGGKGALPAVSWLCFLLLQTIGGLRWSYRSSTIRPVPGVNLHGNICVLRMRDEQNAGAGGVDGTYKKPPSTFFSKKKKPSKKQPSS